MAVLLYAVWSTIFIIEKLALFHCYPIFLNGFRMSIGGIMLISYLFFKGQWNLKISHRLFFSLLLLGFFNMYLSNILELLALKYLSSSKVCFIYSLSPFFAAFFSYLYFGEKLNLRKTTGIFIGFLAIIPVLSLQNATEKQVSITSFLSWPALAIIIAALSSVYGWILLRYVVRDQKISPILANGLSMCIGGVFSIVHSSFTEPWFPVPNSSLWAFVGYALLMIFISNICCYNLYALLLKRFSATYLSLVGLLSPVFANFYGHYFLNEELSWTILYSTFLIAIGLWIVYSIELKQGYIVNKNNPQKFTG